MTEPKTTILAIDDEGALRAVLDINLKREGYRVFTAKNAQSALRLSRKERPDLILLDIGLPEMDGFELLRHLRQETKAPVIFLSGKNKEFDRILGLKLGADDYVTKPFSMPELLARIKVILRRTSPKAEEPKGLRWGELEVDLDRHEVRVHGKLRRLPRREFQLLKLLIEAKGKVLSRDFLLEKFWGYDKSMEFSTRTVDQHVARLRRMLSTEKDRIVTVTNSGYQLKMR